MEKITAMNLLPYLGKETVIVCQVATVFTLRGLLISRQNFCWYGLKLDSGDIIGFSFGVFEVKNSIVTIHIN